MKVTTPVALLALAGMFHAPVMAGDPAAGESVYNARGCVGCHGPAGKQPLATYPAIGGKPAEYIVAEIRKFKSGERNNPIMMPMASMLKDVEVDDVAAYLATQ